MQETEAVANRILKDMVMPVKVGETPLIIT